MPAGNKLRGMALSDDSQPEKWVAEVFCACPGAAKSASEAGIRNLLQSLARADVLVMVRPSLAKGARILDLVCAATIMPVTSDMGQMT